MPQFIGVICWIRQNECCKYERSLSYQGWVLSDSRKELDEQRGKGGQYKEEDQRSLIELGKMGPYSNVSESYRGCRLEQVKVLARKNEGLEYKPTEAVRSTRHTVPQLSESKQCCDRNNEHFCFLFEIEKHSTNHHQH